MWAVKDGKKAPSPFLDISDEISSGGERGLLGLAFHPGFPDDPRVFVDYTNVDGNTVVASLEPGPSPTPSTPPPSGRCITSSSPMRTTTAERSRSAPTGKLLVGMGDGGSGGDPEIGRERLEAAGQILRSTSTRAAPRRYAIPTTIRSWTDRTPEICSPGHAQPVAASIDRATGDLWIGDVGQGAIEEIDVARDRSAGPRLRVEHVEGTKCFKPRDGCDTQGKTMPVAEYTHDFGCTVIGGYVYRGTAHASLTGIYVYADYCSGTMWAIDAADRARRRSSTRRAARWARSARTRRARSISPISAPARSCGSRPATDPRAPAGVARHWSGALRLSRGSLPGRLDRDADLEAPASTGVPASAAISIARPSRSAPVVARPRPRRSGRR